MKFKLLGSLFVLLLFGSLAAGQTASPCGGAQRTLFINWSQFNFNPCHTGYNPYETKLSPSTVGNLSLSWEASWGWTAGQPIVVNGVAYVYSTDCDLRAFNIKTGTLLWKFGPGNKSSNVAATPAVAFGLVYFGSCDGNLYAVNAATGTVAWQAPVQAGDGFSPTIFNAVVYVSPPKPSQSTYAFDAHTGALLWTANTGSPYLPSQPAISNNLVYTVTGDILALDAKTGSPLWFASYQGGENFDSLAVANGVLYAGTSLKNLYGINASTGSLLWTYPFSNAEPAPIIANGNVYVGLNSGNNSQGGVMAFHLPN